MSDNRLVKFDKRPGKMNADIVALMEARSWLEDLMKSRHRGPSDTWTASRDRVADEIGVEPCKLERLWSRWKGMKTVSGGVYRALQQAYQNQCERNEAMAAHHRAVRKAIEDGGSADEIDLAAAQGMGVATARPSAPPVSRRAG